MKTLSIILALACATLSGCTTRTPPRDIAAIEAEPNVIQVYIRGSVNSSRLESFETGKDLARIPFGTPLLDVISVGAGGFTQLAYKKGVRITRFRSGSGAAPERIFLDFTQPDARKVEEVLRDGDYIYVPESWK